MDGIENTKLFSNANPYFSEEVDISLMGADDSDLADEMWSNSLLSSNAYGKPKT